MEPSVSAGRGPITFAVLMAALVVILFIWLWRESVTRDPVELRIKQLGLEHEVASAGRRGRRLGGQHLKLRPGAKLGLRIQQADLPMSASEFMSVTLGLAAAALVLGWLARGPLAGALGACMVVVGSRMLLSMRSRKRLRLMNEQLPDVLTLLVSGMRAGQGLNQALRLVVEQMPEPTAKEFARVVTAVELGQPLSDALEDLAERVGSDDVAMMVTAINVQRQTGGNLAETLDIIAETIRDRIRLQGEIRTLTAQQRLSGNILAVLPLGLAIVVWLMDPTFYQPFLEPGWARLMPIGALVLQGIGYLLIQRIVAIDI